MSTSLGPALVLMMVMVMVMVIAMAVKVFGSVESLWGFADTIKKSFIDRGRKTAEIVMKALNECPGDGDGHQSCKWKPLSLIEACSGVIEGRGVPFRSSIN